MDVTRLYDVLSRLPKRTFIRLIGAEPTMREDLFDIIRTVKGLGHHVSLTTNGLKLAHEPYVAKLKEAGLRLVLLSMNGADDDAVYRVLDEGNWATAKTRALQNILKHNMLMNTGTIIAKGVNEHTMRKQVDLFVKYAVENNYRFKIKPILRFRSIGHLGRFMENSSMDYDELINLASRELGVSVDHITGSDIKANVDVKNNTFGYIFPLQTEIGEILIRLVDWQSDEYSVPDPDSNNRGRITQDFNIAPFFEHVKENEFGY
jgi:molybdenum cofactor biosynthesis enzyme MoaA